MKTRTAYSQFLKSSAGTVSLIFGMSVVPAIILLGMAVDASKQAANHNALQAALDSAALAAGTSYRHGDTNYADVAQKFFNQNAPAELKSNPPTVTVSIDNGAQTLSAAVTGTFKTSMLSIIGRTSTTQNLRSTVSLPVFNQYNKGEIALVLDYSLSMNSYLGGERKYVTMRNGAKDLITALSQSGVNDDVKFALVPFSGEVYVTMEKKYWKGQGSSNALYSSCTRDRKGPYNTTDATPSGTGDRWGFVPNNNPSSQSVNCSSYASHHVEVRDLTTDHQGSLDQISQMSPVGYTNISGAMDMAYQVLSPNAPFTNGVDYGTSGVTKAVVLMTDGAQTTYAFPENGGTNGSVSAGEANLETLCSTMKAQGIRILTVSYDLYDSVTENRLKTCASDDADFYNADTREELISAFSNITTKLARSMYLSE